MSKSKFFQYAVLLAVGYVLNIATSNGEVIAYDNFTITDQRPALSPINGTATEGGNGNLKWGGDDKWIIREKNVGSGSKDGIMSTNGPDSIGILLPFSFDSYQEYGDVATISFSAFYHQTKDAYLGVGFTDGILTWSNGAVWVLLKPKDGMWFLIANSKKGGNGVIIQSGSINNESGADAEWVKCKLSYNQKTNTVTELSFNGFIKLSNYVLPVEPRQISAVSIYAQLPWNTPVGNGIDDFKLEMD